MPEDAELELSREKRSKELRSGGDVRELDVQAVLREERLFLGDPRREHRAADRAVGRPNLRVSLLGPRRRGEQEDQGQPEPAAHLSVPRISGAASPGTAPQARAPPPSGRRPPPRGSRGRSGTPPRPR